MAHPKFCIMGGGISGLCCAYFLQQAFPSAPAGFIALCEGTARLGGWVKTHRSANPLVSFDVGIKSFDCGATGKELLGLIKHLNQHTKIIPANRKAASLRFLLNESSQKTVYAVPTRYQILKYLPRLASEVLLKPRENDLNEDGNVDHDESIRTFAERHFGAAITEDLVDPIVLNNYAGELSNLSIRSYFPRIFHLEKVYGSILKGTISTYFRGSDEKYDKSWLELSKYDSTHQLVQFQGGWFYNLEGGSEQLIRALENKLRYPDFPFAPVHIFDKNPVRNIISPCKPSLGSNHGSAPYDEVKVVLNDGTEIDADCVISALPSYSLSKILENSSLHIPGSAKLRRFSEILENIRYSTVSRVNVGYYKNVLGRRFRGASYYCSNNQKSLVNGMTWDSNLFPESIDGYQGGTSPFKTRIGALVDETDTASNLDNAEQRTIEALRSHLGIMQEPDIIMAEKCARSFPQYEVGHTSRLRELNQIRVSQLPWLQLTGAAFNGVLVSECVKDSRLLCESLSTRFAYFPTKVQEEKEVDWSRRGALCV